MLVYSLTLQNSDGFINIISLTVSSMSRLSSDIQSHGLSGQTWRNDQRGAEVRSIDGYIDDYIVLGADMIGCNTVYNKFDCQKNNSYLLS
jgi:hypothetical protein